jgi:hypothetical protein
MVPSSNRQGRVALACAYPPQLPGCAGPVRAVGRLRWPGPGRSAGRRLCPRARTGGRAEGAHRPRRLDPQRAHLRPGGTPAVGLHAGRAPHRGRTAPSFATPVRARGLPRRCTASTSRRPDATLNRTGPPAGHDPRGAGSSAGDGDVDPESFDRRAIALRALRRASEGTQLVDGLTGDVVAEATPEASAATDSAR